MTPGHYPFRRLTRLTFNYDGATFPAASWHSYVGDLIARFAQARLAFYQGLNIPEFEQGWATRVAQIQTAAAKDVRASQSRYGVRDGSGGRGLYREESEPLKRRARFLTR